MHVSSILDLLRLRVVRRLETALAVRHSHVVVVLLVSRRELVELLECLLPVIRSYLLCLRQLLDRSWLDMHSLRLLEWASARGRHWWRTDVARSHKLKLRVAR